MEGGPVEERPPRSVKAGFSMLRITRQELMKLGREFLYFFFFFFGTIVIIISW